MRIGAEARDPDWSNAPAICGAPYVELPFVDTGREIARRLLRMKMEPTLPPLSIRLKPRLIKEPAGGLA
ncbi:MAG: hypothetical protein NTW86_14815 [Candidatus Sumerlaeota bacterium]|nr:hypothetical protein [Candidatus Sumerlaeota bacterium]